MAQCQQDATKPYFQVRGHIAEIHHWNQSDPHLTLIASPLAPHVTYTFEMAARAEAAHATAVVAIAEMRYKFAHGNLPDKLTDLLSNELEEIPKDPFDGQPLRMAIVDGKWTVYSIGPDGVDDGGKLRAGWKTLRESQTATRVISSSPFLLQIRLDRIRRPSSLPASVSAGNIGRLKMRCV